MVKANDWGAIEMPFHCANNRKEKVAARKLVCHNHLE